MERERHRGPEIIRTKELAYWMGYQAGSRYARTGRAMFCPNPNWEMWRAAEAAGFCAYYQQGVRDGCAEKYGPADELSSRADQCPEVPEL
jgi:hypothetical protein